MISADAFHPAILHFAQTFRPARNRNACQPSFVLAAEAVEECDLFLWGHVDVSRLRAGGESFRLPALPHLPLFGILKLRPLGAFHVTSLSACPIRRSALPELRCVHAPLFSLVQITISSEPDHRPERV